MPALNFEKRFAEPVRLGLIDPHATGAKTQTVRPIWKRPIKPDDVLYLYTGMRTKRCEKLGEAVCLHIQHIQIYIGCFTLKYQHGVLNEYGALDNLNCFAQKDGFWNWQEMQDWFQKRYGLPFSGVLIEW